MNADGSEVSVAGGGSIVFVVLISLAFLAVMIGSMWKVYTKAGQPGWASIVPIYNLVVLLRITGKPLWWLALMAIPLVNFGVMIVLAMDLARSFGQSKGFGVGLLLLGFVFFPMLAFGPARYVGPVGSIEPVLATA
jgi:hypothetical protein